MYWRYYAVLLIWLLPLLAGGQPSETAPQSGDAGETAELPGTTPPSDEPEDQGVGEGETPAVSGDVITLTTGSVLTGVQILRRTPKTLEVEIIEGEEPLSIPMKLVVDIQWDDIDPIKQRRERAAAERQRKDNRLEGQKLLPEFLTKLNSPIGDVDTPFDEGNFVKVIRDCASKVGIEIVVSEGVRLLPQDQRAWSATIPANSSLQDVLSNQLLPAFPNLRVNYPYDKVELTLREEEGATPPALPDAPPPPALPDANPVALPDLNPLVGGE